MKNHSDRLANDYLVLRAQEGDSEALEVLLLRWQKRLWVLASSMTTRDVAQDILQESLLAITRGIRGLEDPACFKSWAYRIVSNKSRDWLRTKQRRGQLEETVREEQVENTLPGQERAAMEADRRLLLQEGLDDLPPDQRAILKLFYLEGMSVRELAVIFDLPDGTVKSRLFHARTCLKRILHHHLNN